MDISTKEITSKKVRGNKADFSTIEITSKKVRGKNPHFSSIEITLKKSTWKRRAFLDQQNYIEKVRGNDVEIGRNLVFDVSS